MQYRSWIARKPLQHFLFISPFLPISHFTAHIRLRFFRRSEELIKKKELTTAFFVILFQLLDCQQQMLLGFAVQM